MKIFIMLSLLLSLFSVFSLSHETHIDGIEMIGDGDNGDINQINSESNDNSFIVTNALYNPENIFSNEIKLSEESKFKVYFYLLKPENIDLFENYEDLILYRFSGRHGDDPTKRHYKPDILLIC